MKSRQRILAVDDNPRNLFIMEKILSESYEVGTADSGEAALDCVTALRPDLILLDIMMPGIDGYETCRRIRDDETLGRPKILMVSAKAMVEERLEGYAVGADDYITKPFSPDELIAKVKVYLELKSVQEIERMRGDLITLLRHETHTPLSVVLSAAEMLRTDKRVPGSLHPLLDAMSASAQRLLRLVERTVTFSKIRGGEVKLELSPTDLNGLLHDAVKKMQADARARSVRLVEAYEGQPVVCVDRTFGDYVIGAFIDNAIGASHENSEVNVRSSVDDEGVSIEFLDHGAGLADELHASAFEPFVVGDIDHHREGAGLGLAIARDLVDLHGGTVRVDRVGHRARFTLRLPLASNVVQQLPVRPEANGDPGLPRAA